MFGSDPDLKKHVQNLLGFLGFLLWKEGLKTAYFTGVLQRYRNVSAGIFGNETFYRQTELKVNCEASCPKIRWTLVHKQL